jgi:hypothetical protein
MMLGRAVEQGVAAGGRRGLLRAALASCSPVGAGSWRALSAEAAASLPKGSIADLLASSASDPHAAHALRSAMQMGEQLVSVLEHSRHRGDTPLVEGQAAAPSVLQPADPADTLVAGDTQPGDRRAWPVRASMAYHRRFFDESAGGRALEEAWNRQIQLETQAVETARSRYLAESEKAALRGEVASMPPARALLLAWFKPLADAIWEEQVKVRVVGARVLGRVGAWAGWV